MVTRVYLIVRHELLTNLKRPLFWFWVFIFGFAVWGLASGGMRIQTSGDSTVGGAKQWLTSEFSFAVFFSAILLILYNFFVAIGAGMSIIRDDEVRIGNILHASPLRPREYVWGKFLGVVISFLAVMAIHTVLAVLFLHIIPSPVQDEIRGPLVWMNYLRPMLFLGLPAVVFIAGVSFAIGEWTRKPILVFVLPIFLILLFGMWLNSWSPRWLPEWGNQALCLIDPYGVRWLTENWMKVDRGTDFYNTQSIEYGFAFTASRIALAMCGFLAVAFSARRFAIRLRGAKHGPLDAVNVESKVKVRSVAEEVMDPDTSLRPLGMTNRKHWTWRDVLTVARFEFKELRYSPGLYLFVPFIILETTAYAWLVEGAFGTPLLRTSGTLAMDLMNVLTLLINLLLLFYTVESQQRERHTNLAPVYYSTGVSTFAILLGKAVSNAFLGVFILIAAFVSCCVILLIQGIVGIEISPFVLVWGVLMIPTFLVWTSFISMLVALTHSRYTTYAIAAAALGLTFYYQLNGDMSWVGNWNLWSIGSWSDVSVFELNAIPLVLNRILALILTMLFTVLAVRLFGRRASDHGRVMHRLMPKSLLWQSLRFAPLLMPALVVGGLLYAQVQTGFQGDQYQKKSKNYWRENLATWRDVETASLKSVSVELDLQPDERRLRSKGTFVVENTTDKPLRQLPITGGTHWRNVTWTLKGEEFEPVVHSGLYVFDFEPPLAIGDRVEVGFQFDGIFPLGVTKNGGGSSEFVLPSGVVLTSFQPSFVPIVGFNEDIGIDEENRYDPKQFDESFFEGITPPLFGGGDRFDVEITIRGPARFRYNSVGVLAEEEVDGDIREMIWRTDHPVSFFNVVGGDWKIKEGERTKVFYFDQHNYNVEEISKTLDAAHKYYSEWFAPYPWEELKLSEFPNLATYAQGFPTNITFSEGIGFLTRNTDGADAAFLVTAHEAAHQWWGNILVPGKGPGGNILSEGMAHFSTGLLFEEVKGTQSRIDFFEKIEQRYGESRRVDAERPLVDIDGKKGGDTTVTYDKGGWVFWMMLNHLGREKGLEGIQAFISHYNANDDYPVLQDFVRVMRDYAEDKEAYDQFIDQWFFKVVLPQFRLEDVEPVQQPDGSWLTTGTIQNMESGTFEVELAVTRGERFGDDGKQRDDYSNSSIRINVEPEEPVTFEIKSDFEPERIVTDPDALLLQLRRKSARIDF